MKIPSFLEKYTGELKTAKSAHKMTNRVKKKSEHFRLTHAFSLTAYAVPGIACDVISLNGPGQF